MESGFQELLDEFLLEARERSDDVESLLLRLPSASTAEKKESIAQTKRELHTLKGNSGMMGFSDLQQIAHAMEDQVELLDLDSPAIDTLLKQLDALRRGLDAVRSPASEPHQPSTVSPATEPTEPEAIHSDSEAASQVSPSPASPSTVSPSPVSASPEPASPVSASPESASRETGASVRVPFSKIDHLVEMQAETLIFRNRLADSVAKGMELYQDAHHERFLEHNRDAWEEVERARQTLEKLLNQLQDHVTELGMVPLQSLLRSLGRIVHDESQREGKLIDFQIRGGDTPIDRTLLEVAGDALGHLVRNAVIHGIELPAERQAQRKRDTGQISVRATLEAGEVRIEISDDGGGVDIEALRAKAQEMSPTAIDSSDLDLLFQEGVSSRQSTDIGAGRGVGLAAVKRSVESRGGKILVRSTRGRGTTFVIHLPVTASILRCLLVRVDDEIYALPLTAVAETVAFDKVATHELNQTEVIRWRGELVPLLDLGLTFETRHQERQSDFVVVIDLNGRRRGLLIDSLEGIRDIVVKGLDNIVGNPSGVSGSTILGDGRVIMILDPSGLIAIPPSTLTRV